MALLCRPGVLHAFDVQHHRLRARVALGPEHLGPKSKARILLHLHPCPESAEELEGLLGSTSKQLHGCSQRSAGVLPECCEA